MKKNIRNIIVYLLIMSITIKSNVIQANAAESIQTEGEEADYAIGYIVPVDLTDAFLVEGGVTTNGLNLRKEPNTNSTILEIMYFGEVVKIDLAESTSSFYYVERDQTKTRGYASRDYIEILQYVR